jgi:hypothetical protein
MSNVLVGPAREQHRQREKQYLSHEPLPLRRAMAERRTRDSAAKFVKTLKASRVVALRFPFAALIDCGLRVQEQCQGLRGAGGGSMSLIEADP